MQLKEANASFHGKGGIRGLARGRLTFDNARQHHLMLGANGFGILIGRAGKGDQILPDIGHLCDFVHQAMPGTIRRSGIIIVFLNQFIHIFDDWLKGPAGIFFLYQPA